MALSRRALLHAASLTPLLSSISALDLNTVQPDLALPPVSNGSPGPGKRVQHYLTEYAGTSLHHLLYLPTDWQPRRRWPVIVEYAGNATSSATDTGEVESSKLGYGLTAGNGAIWLCVPYANQAHTANEKRWWGDLDATIRYLHDAIRLVCRDFNGDPARVILAGFSRGAIACGYIGLHDDATAALWRGLFAYSHFDGVLTRWPYPDADRDAARRRLQRFHGRPVFIAQEQGPDADHRIEATRSYIEWSGVKAQVTYQEVPFSNHDNAWVLRNTPARDAAREWLKALLTR